MNKRILFLLSIGLSSGYASETLIVPELENIHPLQAKIIKIEKESDSWKRRAEDKKVSFLVPSLDPTEVQSAPPLKRASSLPQQNPQLLTVFSHLQASQSGPLEKLKLSVRMLTPKDVWKSLGAAEKSVQSLKKRKSNNAKVFEFDGSKSYDWRSFRSNENFIKFGDRRKR